MRKSEEGRRGNAVTVALLLGTLLGFSALSIDVGLVRVGQTQLQAALDAAAVSGATELDGSLEGMDRARARAVEIAASNHVIGAPVSLTEDQVQVGTWDADAQRFVPWDGVTDPKEVDTVHIDHAPPELGSALAGAAFGVTSLGLHAVSTASRPVDGPARSTDCFLPLAIPDCWLAGLPPGTNPAPLKFTFSPTPTDAIAWGDPDGNPNTAEVRAQLLGQCDQDPIEVGDPIYVNEGVHNSALHTIRDILNDTTGVEPGTWDTSLYGSMPPRDGSPDGANLPSRSDVAAPNWGNTLEGPVAIVDAGDDCSAVSFNHSLPMTSIAWAVIYDVASKGSDKNLYIQLDVVNAHEIWGDSDPELESNVLATGDPTLVRGG